MYATLDELKASSLRNVANKCPNSEDFIDLVNQASEKLMRRGDWSGLVVPIRVCTIGGCVVFPRYVGQIRKINTCGAATPIRNTWYEFLQFDGPRSPDALRWNGWGPSSWNGNWWGGSSWGGWLGNSLVWTGGVNTPVFQDIMGDGRLVRFYPEVQADLGKVVTIFGVDNNDQPLRHKLSDGTWEDGWEVTLASPFGSTTDYVRRIDRILFEDHRGQINGYAYNAAEDVLEQLGTYEAHNNNPTFTRYTLTSNPAGIAACGTNNCGCLKSIVALVKLRFIPARYGTDLVLIQNVSALKSMIQSIKSDEAGNRELARAQEADAIRELNLELSDNFPVEQTPIGNGQFAGTATGIQRCF